MITKTLFCTPSNPRFRPEGNSRHHRNWYYYQHPDILHNLLNYFNTTSCIQKRNYYSVTWHEHTNMQRLQTGKQTEHYYRKQELKCTNSYTHDVVPHRISARFLLHVEMELCLSRPQAVCREPGNKLNSHQGTWWCSLCCQSVWQRFNLPYLVQDLPGPLLGSDKPFFLL